jgi:hypothetical protein
MINTNSKWTYRIIGAIVIAAVILNIIEDILQ